MNQILFDQMRTNALYNIECCYAHLAEAKLCRKNRKLEHQNLGRFLRIDELALSHEKKLFQLKESLDQIAAEEKEKTDHKINSLQRKARHRKKKILKEIEIASDRLKHANESIEISQLSLQSAADQSRFETLSLQSDSSFIFNTDKIKDQLQRTKDRAEKMRMKKNEWEKTINDLRKIEEARKTRSPLRKNGSSAMIKNIMES
ncbi:hypothetical protein TRFO_13148 [Tritrichomonas foetus]|uniref:Uncharacterized protein n=1 Tax=Tritrichomonas foetus TaxID=1144522 RepID=A0A1J4KZ72_9EUKA|nr:hypothetical protein TRFO_13148 [Tritrichomonas foetus]|eukprot:OHT16553.1 hypothetical protein TRFO_13148 [Tritrichomonas foetus]